MKRLLGPGTPEGSVEKGAALLKVSLKLEDARRGNLTFGNPSQRSGVSGHEARNLKDSWVPSGFWCGSVWQLEASSCGKLAFGIPIRALACKAMGLVT